VESGWGQWTSVCKVRQDGNWFWLGSVQPEIWSLGFNGCGLEGRKELVAWSLGVSGSGPAGQMELAAWSLGLSGSGPAG
jgi:hypothetical protein